MFLARKHRRIGRMESVGAVGTLRGTSPGLGRATIRAIVKDKAEIALLPGPGKGIRALMDRFPELGPRVNRISGAEATMQTVAQIP